MNFKNLFVCVPLLCLVACGSPDSKKNKDSKGSDTSDTIAAHKQDTSNQLPEIDATHSERRENTLVLSDTLITKQLSSNSDTSNLEKKVGMLRYSGNEPFVFPALFESDSISYRLVADDTFLNQTFRDLNGNRVTLFGKVLEVDNRQVFEVHYYKRGNEN